MTACVSPKSDRAGQESVRRRTRAREQFSKHAETVPSVAGSRQHASRARSPCD